MHLICTFNIDLYQSLRWEIQCSATIDFLYSPELQSSYKLKSTLIELMAYRVV